MNLDRRNSNTYTLSITIAFGNTYMQVTTTVTQKGQITLPKQFRQMLGIDKYDKVVIKATKKSIKIKPFEDILDLAGTLQPRKNRNKSALEARVYMETHYKRV